MQKINTRSSPRFPLEAVALLWPDESDPQRTIWTHTKDISRTGIYIRGDFQVSSTIKFEVQLPAPMGGARGGTMRGYGHFVRYDLLGTDRLGFAATIEGYQIHSTPTP